MEEKTGKILSISSDLHSGILQDENDGKEFEFSNPTTVVIEKNEAVLFILIKNPTLSIEKAVITGKKK